MITEPIMIPLAKYGGEGFVEMDIPPLEIELVTEAEAAALLATFDDQGNATLHTENAAYAELTRTLSYVRSAPFEANYRSFLDYTNKLDAKRRRAGRQLLTAMEEAIKKIEEGETSPFQECPAQVTPSSD